ncbi:MAG: hypothetical protein IPM46_06100 [Flavobacteriales bacterium]|nr:hypothetical protein [Flavobacteriales bacterium]
MALRFSLCPYRLRFKRPFGTAHGLRDGTDALFIRMEQDGISGHGEVTLPPYVKESVSATIERIKRLASMGPWDVERLTDALNGHHFFDAPACRAGLQMALMDLAGKRLQRTVYELLETTGFCLAETVMTIGICTTQEALAQLRELPETGALKLKVGDSDGLDRVKAIVAATNARILLDGNQGMLGVGDAAELAAVVGPERLIGFEQPFGVDGDKDSAKLGAVTGSVIIADESLQEGADLDRVAQSFGGVNIKLMKCGGLDRAKEIAVRARRRGLKLMLGSMSESSLGCTAMAHLGGGADVLDLDGPWLIANDPFEGVVLDTGRLVLPEGPGLGVKAALELNYSGV